MLDITQTIVDPVAFRVTLGDHPERTITEHGFDIDKINPFTSQHTGARRTIEVSRCSLIGCGGEVKRDFCYLTIIELPLDRTARPETHSWALGSVDLRGERVTLCVTPIIFQQLWETVDAPKDERPTIEVTAHDLKIIAAPENERTFHVSEVRLKVSPMRNPVEREIHKVGRSLRANIVSIGFGVFSWTIAIGLALHWLWH